jgi:plasmid replication initiation protein
VRFTAYDMLVTTNRGTGGREYALLEGALERLSGTRIKTNIKVGGQRIREGFGLIESWKVVERAPNDNRMVSIEITLPKWLFEAIKAREVLALNRDYFRLRKPLDRRLYELARKHCGRQPTWRVSVPVLHRKAGSSANLREFRRMVGITARSNHLPDYTISIDEEDMVLFIRRSAVIVSEGE